MSHCLLKIMNNFLFVFFNIPTVLWRLFSIFLGKSRKYVNLSYPSQLMLKIKFINYPFLKKMWKILKYCKQIFYTIWIWEKKRKCHWKISNCHNFQFNQTCCYIIKYNAYIYIYMLGEFLSNVWYRDLEN